MIVSRASDMGFIGPINQRFQDQIRRSPNLRAPQVDSQDTPEMLVEGLHLRHGGELLGHAVVAAVRLV